MIIEVFAENRRTFPSRVVHGIAPLTRDRGWALLCDVRIYAHLMSHHVRVTGSMNQDTFEMGVTITEGPIDCMACLVAHGRRRR